MMGSEAGILSPTHDELEELDLNSGMKKRHRRSFGGETKITRLVIESVEICKNVSRIGQINSSCAGCNHIPIFKTLQKENGALYRTNDKRIMLFCSSFSR